MKNKKEIIENYKIHDNDTGSSSIQIAILSERINGLVGHLKKNKKDHHSRRGLIIMVGKRKRFMKYLKKKDSKEFDKITTQLKLKVKK